MAELPPPPELPDVAVVTMVHRVKSRLGYTEINTPVSFENDKVNAKYKTFFYFSICLKAFSKFVLKVSDKLSMLCL